MAEKGSAYSKRPVATLRYASRGFTWKNGSQSGIGGVITMLVPGTKPNLE